MHTPIPPSPEVMLTEKQKSWDAQKKKTDFWLSFMSWTVCLALLTIVTGLLVWSVTSVVAVFLSENRDSETMIELLMTAGGNTGITLLATVVIAIIFEFMRGKMEKVRWNARERLGDRPGENDAHADNYEHIDVDLIEVGNEGYVATVNGWQFFVDHKVNKVADGKHRMDFSFTEVNGAKGLSFGSSVIMDEFHRETKHEAIKTTLSKMFHVYPELKTAPPADYYSER